MRILVVNALDALSQRAYAINSIKMAEGFASMGHEVTILCSESKEGKVSSEQMADVYADVDRYYLLQIVENLVSNALKFSPQGSKIFCLDSR